MELHKQDTEDTVYFYEQEFYVLSNYSAFNLIWKGQKFDTSEAAYHWEKFPMRSASDKVRFTIQRQIRTAPSAHAAQKVAQANKEHIRKDWNKVKLQVMYDILKEKVNQHEYVKKKLLETGDRELVEDSWRDSFWGWGPNKDGKNVLGKIWMKIRKELQND